MKQIRKSRIPLKKIILKRSKKRTKFKKTILYKLMRLQKTVMKSKSQVMREKLTLMKVKIDLIMEKAKKQIKKEKKILVIKIRNKRRKYMLRKI